MTAWPEPLIGFWLKMSIGSRISLPFTRCLYFDPVMKKLLLVLGSGRSGTSLLMQFFVNLGITISDNVIEENVSNPAGFYEDADLRAVHTKLLADLFSHPSLQLPRDWQSESCTVTAVDEIKKVLLGYPVAVTGFHALKDPLINCFLPMWIRIFNQCKIVPIFFFANRDAASVISSFISQYNYPPHLAELVWLNRTVDALHFSAYDVMFVQYEDWRARPTTTGNEIVSYFDPKRSLNPDVDAISYSIYRPNLDRASHIDYAIENPFVIRLSRFLSGCRGSEYDRDALRGIVRECREAMEGFKGWHQLANDAKRKLASTTLKLEKATTELTKLKSLELRVRELEIEKRQSEQLSQQVLRLQWQLDHFSSLSS
jgi:hypothetical protein